MKWPSRFLVCLLLGLSTGAFAEPQAIERSIKGKAATDINAGIFATVRKNCTAAAPPTIRLVNPPAHGRVRVKQAKVRATNLKRLEHCLGVELPAFIAIYRSGRDFVGQDVFTLEIINSKGKSQFQRIIVNVTQSGSQQGI